MRIKTKNVVSGEMPLCSKVFKITQIMFKYVDISPWTIQIL